MLNNSFSTSDSVYQTYASENLCATSHTLPRGDTGANRPSTDTEPPSLAEREVADPGMFTEHRARHIHHLTGANRSREHAAAITVRNEAELLALGGFGNGKPS